MKIKLAFAAITLTALGVVGCTPTDTPVETYPFCDSAVNYSDSCIEVSDPVAQTGWLIHSDGSPSDMINYWLDGTIEIH